MKIAELASNLSLNAAAASGHTGDITRQFRPPRRFGATTFESYRPDPTFPSQAEARRVTQEFIAAPAPVPKPTGWRAWFGRAQPPAPGLRGLYLDGGFGVGKTHLLAAAWHATAEPKAYLTFQELIYALIALGRVEAVNVFARYRLICIDEFELDDLGSTTLVAALLRELRGIDVRLIATSNTLPSDLGQGRFHAADFKREIGEIAAVFTVVTIDGEDYRHRERADLATPPGLLSRSALQLAHAAHQPARGGSVWATFAELNTALADRHPIWFAQMVEPIDALFLAEVAPLPDENLALRFVHFIDKLYDHDRRLALSATCPLPDVFPASYRHGGYRKKYGRCLSRLTELLHEAGRWLPATARLP